MKNTIKTLINQVKKAISGKTSLPLCEKAYADKNGNLVARTFKDNADIIVFVGGIVEDITKREAIYTKDNLTVAADTGIFNGGKFLRDMESPDTVSTFYDLPDADFIHAVTVPADDLKAAAYTVSKDTTRRILNYIHFTVSGMIESCDGFRAYRKHGNALNPTALDKFESVDGLLLPYPATAYGLKGEVKIYNSDKHLKLEDATGLILYVRKPNQANYMNMDKVYEGYNRSGNTTATVTIKDKKGFLSVIKNSISTERRQGLWLRVRNGFIDYLSDKLDAFGSIEAETSNETPADFYIKLNPKYLYDALGNQDGIKIYFPKNQQSPLFITDAADTLNALLLPIREDKASPFWQYDKQLKEATEKKAEATPALVTTATDADQEAPTPAADPEKPTPTEAATPEKLEIVKREEITPPEIVKARRFYKQMRACNFKPTAIQEAEAETIYKLNREQLQPIARQAGNLYIDTLSIIAAIMSVYEN